MTDKDKHGISDKTLQRHFDLTATLFEFNKMFAYDKGDDRSIVIIGATFLDTLLEHILLAFFPDDDADVSKLFEYEEALGTYGNKIKMVYCLGLIDKIIRDDLKLIGKIRNKFAHDLFSSFADDKIKNWCKQLKWHKESLMMDPPQGASIRDLYQVGVNQLITHLSGTIILARGQKREIKRDF